MKFANLNPRWLTPEVLIFQCPACANGMLSLKSVPMTILAQMALFHEKLGEPEAGRVHPCQADQSWTFVDRNFATFTARPSLNVKGHWHHTITNGEIV